MSYANRLQRLETQLHPAPGPVFGIPVSGPESDGELIAYRVGDALVERDDGEDRHAFNARVRASHKTGIIVLFEKDDIGL